MKVTNNLAELAMSSMPHEEFMDRFQELMRAVQLEERQRAKRIILEFEVYTPYIVQKRGVAERKQQLIDMIMDGMDNGIQEQGRRESGEKEVVCGTSGEVA